MSFQYGRQVSLPVLDRVLHLEVRTQGEVVIRYVDDAGLCMVPEGDETFDEGKQGWLMTQTNPVTYFYVPEGAVVVDLQGDEAFSYLHRWYPAFPIPIGDPVSATVEATGMDVDPALARMLQLERFREQLEEGRTPGLTIDDHSNNLDLFEDFPFSAEDPAPLKKPKAKKEETDEGPEDLEDEKPPAKPPAKKPPVKSPADDADDDVGDL